MENVKIFGGYKVCEICDNSTPQIWVEEAKDFGCEVCFDAYGVEGMEFQKGIENEKNQKSFRLPKGIRHYEKNC